VDRGVLCGLGGKESWSRRKGAHGLLFGCGIWWMYSSIAMAFRFCQNTMVVI
jgi:hypothetical protein